MEDLRPRRLLLLFGALCALLGIVLFALFSFLSSAQQTPTSEITSALERTQSATSFKYRGAVHKTVTPAASLSTIAQSSQTQSIYLEGVAFPHSGDLLLEIWSGTASVSLPATAQALKVEDGATYIRGQDGEWQPYEGNLRPVQQETDFLALARMVREVTAIEETTIGGVKATHYSFTMDARAYAEHLRDLAMEELRLAGHVAPGYQLEVPKEAALIEGSGEIWVGEGGLPLRQQMRMVMPTEDGGSRVTTFVIDFSGFEGVSAQAEDGVAAWMHFDIGMGMPIESLLATGLLLFAACWMAVMAVRRRANRVLYTAVAAAVIGSMVATPILTNLKILDADRYIIAQAASGAASPGAPATLPAVPATGKANSASTFDPHHNPLAASGVGAVDASRKRVNLSAVPIELRAPEQPVQSVLLQSSDGDTDGLSDWNEAAIGTNPESSDTDRDGVDDFDEVTGLEHAGRRWFTDPIEADTNGDSILDGIEWDANEDGTIDDTDSDGIPDVFDDDNDGDGVPDWLDISPNSAPLAGFSADLPLSYRVDKVGNGNTTYVDIQLAPQNRDQLWYAFSVADWPRDEQAFFKDLNDLSFAEAGKGSGAPEDAWGDLRVVPTLEIRVANAAATMPPQRLMDAFGISANAGVGPQGERYIYVPLSLVVDDRSGARVGFSARIPYELSGQWGDAHQARLAWIVQGMNDFKIPCSLDDPACPDEGYEVHYNQPSVVATYYERWDLTGMTVSEEYGTTFAAVYEDPARPAANLHDQSALYGLSRLLDDSFIATIDHDGGGAPDITIDEIAKRFNRTNNDPVSEIERWGLPDNFLVETLDAGSYVEAVATVSMTLTKEILGTHFDTHWQSDQSLRPLVMYLSESKSKSLALPAVGTFDPTALVFANTVSFNFEPAGSEATPLLTLAGKKWTMYCSPPTGGSAIWSECDTAAYWNETRTQYRDGAQLHDDPDGDLASGRTGMALFYTLAMKSGLNIPIQFGTVLMAPSTLNEDDYLLWSRMLEIMASVDAGEPFAVASVADAFEERVEASVELYAATAVLDVAWGFADLTWWSLEVRNALYHWSEITFDEVGEVSAMIALAVITVLSIGLLIATIIAENTGGSDELIAALEYTGYALEFAGIAALGLSLAANIAGGAKIIDTVNKCTTFGMVLGVVMAVVVNWGIFIATLAISKLSPVDPLILREAANAFASMVVDVALALISVIPIVGQIIVGLLALIDTVLYLVCEYAVGERMKFLSGECFTLTDAVKWVASNIFYGFHPMVSTTHDYLMRSGAPQYDSSAPDGRYVGGVPIHVTLPVTTTIFMQDPQASNGFAFLLYAWQMNIDEFKSTAFRYRLVVEGQAVPPMAIQRNSNFYDWYVTPRPAAEGGPKWAAQNMFHAAKVDHPAVEVTLDSGINQPLGVRLDYMHITPNMECFPVPFPWAWPFFFPVCHVRDRLNMSSIHFPETSLDVLPATLDEFMARSEVAIGDEHGGGMASVLTWEAAFANYPLADGDGDGLHRSIDPRDNTWDTDGDGLSDAFELSLREEGIMVSPLACDSDGDGLTDRQELRFGTNPNSRYSDTDTLEDGQEVFHQVYTANCQPKAEWAGGWTVAVDGLPNGFFAQGNPLVADADNDGVDDAIEYARAVTAPALDLAEMPYVPGVANLPEVELRVSIDDQDKYLGPNQHFTVTYEITASQEIVSDRVEIDFDDNPLVVPAGGGVGNGPIAPNRYVNESHLFVIGNVTYVAETHVTVAIVERDEEQQAFVKEKSTLRFHVDGAPPHSAISTLKHGQYVQAGTSASPITLIVGGNATDEGAGVEKVEVRVNGGAWNQAVGAGAWSYPVAFANDSAAATAYVIETRAIDRVGNVGPVSAVTIHADSKAPNAIRIAGPTPNTWIKPARNADGDWVVPLIVNSSDGASGVKSTEVMLRPSVQTTRTVESSWQEVVFVLQGECSYTTPLRGRNGSLDYLVAWEGGPPEGVYDVVARTVDCVGNGSDSVIGSINVDAGAPAAVVNNAAQLDPILAESAMLQGSVRDNGVGVVTAVELRLQPMMSLVNVESAILALEFDEGPKERFFENRAGGRYLAYCDEGLAKCPQSGQPGRDGTSIFFPAGSDEAPLLIENPGSLNLAGEEGFAVSMWVKPVSVLGGLFHKSGAIGISLVNGQVHVSIGDGTYSWTGSKPVRVNEWNHIVVSVQRVGQGALGALWVNGVLDNTSPMLELEMPIDREPIWLGGAGINSYYGSIDQFMLFDSSLSEQRIKALYRDPSPPWQAATLTGSAGGNYNWSYTIAGDYEGDYRLEARVRDSLGNMRLLTNIWRGVVDTVAPRFTAQLHVLQPPHFTAGQPPRFHVAFTCSATDGNLDPASMRCPENPTEPPTRVYDDGLMTTEIFTDVAILRSMTYRYMRRLADVQAPRFARACDTVGNCATVRLTTIPAGTEVAASDEEIAAWHASAEGGAPTAPSAIILAPLDGSRLSATTSVAVEVLVTSKDALRDVALILNGAVVNTTSFSQEANVLADQRSHQVALSGVGPFRLEVVARDWKGVVQSPRDIVTFTVDLAAPVVSIANTTINVEETYGYGSGFIRLRGTVQEETCLAVVQVSIDDRAWADARVEGSSWRAAVWVDAPEGRTLETRVRAVDCAGQTGEARKSLATNLSGQGAPETRFTATPAAVSGASVQFGVEGIAGANELAGVFCQLDDGLFALCSTPHLLTGLAGGMHTLRARAVDSKGWVDTTPATFTWQVSAPALAVSIAGAPPATSASRSASFTFSGAAEVTKLECALDQEAFVPCTSPTRYQGLVNGSHTFRVRGVNHAGALGAVSTHTWEVVNGAPTVAAGSLTTYSGMAAQVTLAGSDPNGDALAYRVTGRPTNGVLFGIAPSLTYQSSAGFVGRQTVTYWVDDGNGGRTSGSVTIDVIQRPAEEVLSFLPLVSK